MFEIRFKPSVEKDFRGIPKNILLRILGRIDELKSQPLPAGSLKLTGADRLYRLRIGDYRVVYEVESAEKRVTVHYVRHRRDVYKSL